MAITIVSDEIQSAYSREKIVLRDQYGATQVLYVSASQLANRETLLQARITDMTATESATTAMLAAGPIQTPPTPPPTTGN